MTKKPFREQLSKFSLLGELPKVENGFEEAWGNLKKCTEPFTAQDIIKQQQETINRQKAEIEILVGKREVEKAKVKRLKEELKTIAVDQKVVKAFAIKEFAERLKADLDNVARVKIDDYDYYCVGLGFIDNLVKEMVGDSQ